jgi:hypothetical protein
VKATGSINCRPKIYSEVGWGRMDKPEGYRARRVYLAD